jgi:hypothetical protein
MFIYGAVFFLYRPGLVLATLGLALTLPLAAGPITLGPITFSLYWMLLGLTLLTLGLQCLYFGIIAQTFFDYRGEVTSKWFRRFPYTRTVAFSAAGFTLGVGLAAALLVYYVRHDFVLTSQEPINHVGLMGVLLMITSFMTFTFTLLLHSTALAVWRRP